MSINLNIRRLLSNYCNITIVLILCEETDKKKIGIDFFKWIPINAQIIAHNLDVCGQVKKNTHKLYKISWHWLHQKKVESFLGS